MLLASVAVAAAFLAWLTVARNRRLSAVVLAALLAVAVGTVALAAAQLRAAAEPCVLLFLGVVATLLVAREVQRRRLTHGDPAQATDGRSSRPASRRSRWPGGCGSTWPVRAGRPPTAAGAAVPSAGCSTTGRPASGSARRKEWLG
ncbi:hypothetical protein ABZ807_10045 [Micromonospora sp. NPDC047548]|uniref:hypothetical protein n=1 Tax=Micromonospora sp. NPDC047548 TaxID=3155624 RepID=UPI0033FEA49F